MPARRRCCSTPRIIRNRAKVRAFRENARATLALRESHGGLDGYLWGFVGGSPIVNRIEGIGQLPAETELSRIAEPRPDPPRLQVRRPGHRLRLHAVDRAWSTTTSSTASVTLITGYGHRSLRQLM